MKSRTYINLFILLLYSALVFFGVFHHEPWRDEAHPWMVARENSVATVFTDARYDGVPILWFLLLMPFAKAGFPYITLNIIDACIAIAAVGLLLRFGKIPLPAKILFIFSYYMAYEYAVIARNYVLTVFLLFSIASIFKKRFDRPLLYAALIFLLYQTNVYSIAAAGILMTVYITEIIIGKKYTRKRLWAAIMMVIGALITFIMLFPDRSNYYNTFPPINKALEVFVVMRASVVPVFKKIPVRIFMQIPFFDTVIIILVFFLLLSFIVMILKNKINIFYTVMMLGWIFVMNVFIHEGFIRHCGLILIYLIFLWWITDKEKIRIPLIQKIATGTFIILLNILLSVSVIFTLRTYYMDYKYDFSGGHDMAQYIKLNNLERIETVVYYGSFAEAVLPYFKEKKFWYPEFEKSGYFNLFDQRSYSKWKQITKKEILDIIKNNFSGNKPVLLLLSIPLVNPESGGYELLHKSEAKYFWGTTESFWLYGKNIR